MKDFYKTLASAAHFSSCWVLHSLSSKIKLPSMQLSIRMDTYMLYFSSAGRLQKQVGGQQVNVSNLR
jgi:hypothetical protein